MLSRTSIVDRIKVDTIIFSSVFEIGDSTYIQGFSRALAVHRESDTFYGKEGNFDSYYAFTKPIPFPPIEEPLSMYVHNLCPAVKVQNIDILGVSSSSVIQIGSSQHVSMEVRVKHIRQLNSKNHQS